VTSALSLIAKNTSFSEETVMKVWKKMGSIERTEEYFNRIKEAINKASEKIYEDMEREEQRGEEGRRSLRGSTSELRAFESSPPRIDLEHRPSSSSPRRLANLERPDLNIRPLRQDSGDVAMSDYSPPHSSRAGQYTRLVKQGRTTEAVERERRRASIGGIGVFIPREPSIPRETSQTPEVHVEEAEAEAEAEEVPRTRSPTVESEVSDDVDALDLELPEDSQWGVEEETAFMSATAGNAHELRAIESRMDPEFMRKWAAMHLIRLMQKAQVDEPLGE
jgi:hypothetical protein